MRHEVRLQLQCNNSDFLHGSKKTQLKWGCQLRLYFSSWSNVSNLFPLPQNKWHVGTQQQWRGFGRHLEAQNADQDHWKGQRIRWITRTTVFLYQSSLIIVVNVQTIPIVTLKQICLLFDSVNLLAQSIDRL